MVALMAASRIASPGRRAPFVVLALVAAGILAACTEDFQGGAACPALCPEQNVVVFDTSFDPVELDTTVTGCVNFDAARLIRSLTYGLSMTWMTVSPVAEPEL